MLVHQNTPCLWGHDMVARSTSETEIIESHRFSFLVYGRWLAALRRFGAHQRYADACAILTRGRDRYRCAPPIPTGCGSCVICPTGCPAIFVSSSLAKNFPLSPSGKSPLRIRPSRLTEGRLAIVPNAGRGAMDASGASDEGALLADGEVVWS